MLTFVIPLTAKVADLGLAAPFLYPLQANGQVRLVPASLPRDMLDEYVRLEVRYGSESLWQLLFLLHQDDRLSSPLDDSLTATLWQIRDEVLAPLAAHELYPYRVYVGVMDEVQRLPGGNPAPRHPLAWQRWRLDATGLVTTATEPFLFTTTELAELREIWGTPLSLEGITTNRGLASLTSEIQENIRARLAKLRQRAEELIDTKLTACPGQPPTGTAPFARPEILRGVREAYSQYLTELETCQDCQWLSSDNPADKLAELLAHRLSLKVVIQDLTLIFFRGTGAVPFQRLLLHLVYGLQAVAIAPEAFEQTGGRLFQCQVDFDPSEWTHLLAAWQEVLHQAGDFLKAQTNETATQSWPEPDEIAGHCQQALNNVNIPELSFPWLRQPRDLETWQKWQQQVGQELNKQQREADRLLQACQQELTQRRRRRPGQELANLRDFLQTKQEELHQARLALLQNKPASPPEALAVLESGLEPRTIGEAIQQRPNLQSLIKVWGAASLLASFPQLLYAWHYGKSDLYLQLGEFLGIFIAAGGLAALGALWYLRRRLRTLIAQVQGAANKALEAISERFAQSKAYLQEFWKCQALHETLLLAQEQAEALEQRLRQTRYHLRMTEQHLQNLAQLAALMKITVTEPSPGNPASRDWQRESRPIAVEKPVADNPIYWPPWDKTGPATATLQVGNQKVEVSIPTGRGVQQITFADLTAQYFQIVSTDGS